MSLKIKCPGCRSTLRVAEKYAGRQVKCPGCQHEITVPALEGEQPDLRSAPRAPRAEETATDADDSFAPPDEAPHEDEPPPLPAPRGRTDTRAKKSPVDQTTEPPPRPRSLSTRAKIAMIAGGIAALAAVAVGAMFLVSHGFRSGTTGPFDTPYRVTWGGTKFVLGLKDAWYVDSGENKGAKKRFCVVYSCTNLGPREGHLALGRAGSGPLGASKAEITTDKGRIYGDKDFARGPDWLDGPDVGFLYLGKLPQRDGAGMRWKITNSAGETGESAVFFEIPEGETPIEFTSWSVDGTKLKTTLESGDVNAPVPWLLDFKRDLPSAPFAARRYSKIFGFVPATEEAVSHLTGALEDKEIVVRIEAAKVLGELGPIAKSAIPALQNAMRRQKPRASNTIAEGVQESVAAPWLKKLRDAAKEEIEKIGDASTDVVPVLIEALRDDDLNVRLEAAKDLGELGAAAKAAIPALKEANDRPVAFRAFGQTVETIHPDQAYGQAIKKIDPDEFVRFENDFKVRGADGRHAGAQRQATSRRQAEERVAATMQKTTRVQSAAQERRESELHEQEERTKGPLSGIWRDKTGPTLRIEDDGKALDIKLSGFDSSLRQFAGKLTRRDEKPDSFEGDVKAVFSRNISNYLHRVTATLDKAKDLEVRFPEWPDPRGRTKKKTTLKAIWSRQGPLPKPVNLFPTSTPNTQNRLHSLRQP